MKMKAEKREENSVTESSTHLMSKVKKTMVSEAEEEASDVKEIVELLEDLALEAEEAMKVDAEAEERMLPNKTTCYLTRISQPCEKGVRSMTRKIEMRNQKMELLKLQ